MSQIFNIVQLKSLSVSYWLFCVPPFNGYDISRPIVAVCGMVQATAH